MPTTTNGFTYPAATATPDVPRDIQQLATDIESKLGPATAAPATWTPTLTNVTGGTVTGRWVQIGKFLFIAIDLSAGTVTAAGAVTLTLPAGKTADTTLGSALSAVRNATPVSARIAATATAITLVDNAGASFAAGLSLVPTRITGMVLVQ